MSEKNRVYEAMTKVVLCPRSARHANAGWTIRVWTEHPELIVGPIPAIQEYIIEVARRGWIIEDILDGVSKLESVAACEAVDMNGNGALIYPDWK